MDNINLRRESFPAKQVLFLAIYQGKTNHQGSEKHDKSREIRAGRL